MTVLTDHPPVVPPARRPVDLSAARPVAAAAAPCTTPSMERTTVAALLTERLVGLGERLHRDGLDAHHEQLLLVADAVRPTSAVLADVLTGGYVAPMRERAFARAVRLILLRPARHAGLALALAS